ncbi:uncharacterized protein LOC141697977 [Apium graveolens]|uniref:uncharacterized protein LOC141697977 n=1 Tax=Apium graveolens TaxID=4045 RepID=UPI003D7AC507
MNQLDVLYDAAIAGDANAIAELEEKANRLYHWENTILHTESQNGNTDRVRFILKEFANKNLLEKVNLRDETALHLAIEGGHTEVAALLIDEARRQLPVLSFLDFLRQADRLMEDTALHVAAMYGNVAIVKLLVEADLNYIHIQNKHGCTATDLAVEGGFNDIVEIISPSLDGPDGSTALRVSNLNQDYDAAIAGEAEAKAKLELEADILNDDDETILHIESQNGNTERVQFILTKLANKKLLPKLTTYKQTALHRAIFGGHIEVAKVIINAASGQMPETSFQAFLRQGDEDLDSALHAAVMYGNLDIVKLLVEVDPTDKHSRNYNGKTPVYLAAENGYFDIVKAICKTCKAPSLDGPGGSTALHAAISNIHKATEEDKDVTRLLIDAAKRWRGTEEAKKQYIEAFFNGTDEDGLSLLELAVGKNDLGVVKVLLQNDPAYGRGNKKNGLMRSIYISVDNGYSDIVNLLSEAYEAGKVRVQKGKTKGLMNFFSKYTETGEAGVYKGVVSLILAIRKRDKDDIRRRLKEAPRLLNFVEDEGWTPLHYVIYHKFDLILDVFIEAQREIKHPFEYEYKSTPFHVAAESGYTPMMIRLMQLWPSSSCAYTAVNKIDRNILHIAAAEDNKEMIQGILNNCPQIYMEEIIKQQDANKDTFLHLLFLDGCFIPEVIKHEGLVRMTKNNDNWTPRDMLYCNEDVVSDQALIKLALEDELHSNQSRIFWWKSTKKKMDFLDSNVPVIRREAKDLKFNEKKIAWMAEKQAKLVIEKKTNLDKYKERTNTQIIVCALITTVTFTVGFTMPGGLRQSEQVDEGLVVLSRKSAFNAFMVSDALALLLSTSSLFFYFLGSLSNDHHEVQILSVVSTGFNIVSIVAMMLTFITGTYVVLSHSPALAITVCIIGSLFFLLLIVMSIMIVCFRPVKPNED